jgi:hypothetical protein
MGVLVSDPKARYRHEKRHSAIIALTDLDPQDAALICVEVLDVIKAATPAFDPWGDLRADAEFWAGCANPAELEAYFLAALKQLQNQLLGIRARKKILANLFQDLSASDRQSFVQWVMRVSEND